MNEAELVNRAIKAMQNAYAPYSEFTVGAALLCESGEVFIGVNIENASYPAGICAERSAFAAALSAGEREFAAIAVVGGHDGEIKEYCPPCGICRQFMNEFCDESFRIILCDGINQTSFSLPELLPGAFGGEIL